MNHYEILGVEKTATDDEIKRAYRKLASTHHPDKGGDTQKFQEIQVAYNTLSSPESRQMYDMQLNGSQRQHFNFGNQHDMDIDDILKHFHFSFGDQGNPFGFRPQQPRRNRDMRIEIPVSLESTLATQTKTVQVRTAGGTESTVEVTIPRGVTSESVVKYPNLGDNLFSSLPRGDLYVHFRIQNADNFQVNGLDLYTKLQTDCLLLITGGEITVQGLDKKIFEITIPKGTQGGTKFRIPQEGLYQTNSPQRGDLYVEIVVSIPDNLSPEQLGIIQTVANSLHSS
ncbi:MAG TPA: J domain-containing protein [Methanosarcina sp.]|nr:J domain-containing protein [Methanosarcina sp.]